jgi:hypothetical protein
MSTFIGEGLLQGAIFRVLALSGVPVRRFLDWCIRKEVPVKAP